MNEKLEKGQEMLLAGFDQRKVISVILGRALETRPKEEVSFRPFLACKYVGYTRTLSSQKVRLGDRYPEAEPGDGAFVDFQIRCHRDEVIYLNVSAGVKVWYEGECIYDGIGGTADTGEKLQKNVGGGDKIHLPIMVKQNGDNFVRIFCVKKENMEFSFEFLLSVKRYPFMWANDYLFWARAVLPVPERGGEEGAAISRLYRASELEVLNSGTFALGKGQNIAYQWPPALFVDESFDFEALCGEGDICYVYTEAACDHTLSFLGNVECVYLNNKKTWVSENGYSSRYLSLLKDRFLLRSQSLSGNRTTEGCTGRLEVKKGDRLLFRCRRNKIGWKFSLDTAGLCLPFLSSKRKTGSRVIYIGPFYGAQCHGPEYEWDFSRVFVNQKGQRLYWKFCDGSELRIYLDSIFFGQWFYALMVGFYGIRNAARFLEDELYQGLFVDNMCFMARYFDYVKYDIEKHVMPAFMPRLYEMNVLDNIGTMGMNLIDAYLDSSDKSLLPVIECIRQQAEKAIPRLEDGTYYRLDTMWADDLFMSCPFLVRMGRLTGDPVWYEKAKAQIQGFRRRLYMEEEHLFSHIYFPGKGVANRVPWGRGNGWVMWTLSELLVYGEGKVNLTAEKELFCQMAASIRALQGESGLWRQVLNRTEEGSYLETSCTGMFLLSFTRGVRYGWLGEDFLECMEKAWKGLLTYSVDREGNVYGVCMGSGCQMEAEYYFTIPTILNDDHGTGVILAAGSEYCALLEERTKGME